MSASLLTELTRAETSVWDALVRGDAAADRALLSPEFLGVYPDGFARRDAHVQQLHAGPTVLSFRLSDLRAKALGTDHALLSYRADFTRAGTDRDEAMYVSSIWQRAASGWLNVFSQDTPATA